MRRRLTLMKSTGNSASTDTEFCWSFHCQFVVVQSWFIVCWFCWGRGRVRRRKITEKEKREKNWVKKLIDMRTANRPMYCCRLAIFYNFFFASLRGSLSYTNSSTLEMKFNFHTTNDKKKLEQIVVDQTTRGECELTILRVNMSM